MVVTRTAVKPKDKATSQAGSGLRRFAAGEVVFNDGDHANSLYIIQKGQMRLYKPKGRGFIEIAVLRAGEVIGEMAYFDEDGSGNRRSCAASAMINTEVIEISFPAFSKTMAGLNPWFKTIINTLASRLRKANSRIRELEANSVSHNYGGAGASTYEFFRSVDVVKTLSVLFLVLKGHGEKHASGISCHRNTMNFYAFEIFNVMESKFDEMINMLVEMEFMSIAKDGDGFPKVLVATHLDVIRQLLIFFNSQRIAPEEKKLKIPAKCEDFLEKILVQIGSSKEAKVEVNLSKILDAYKTKNIFIDLPNLEEARAAGFVGEVIVGDGNALSCDVQLARLIMTMPSIRMMNRLTRFNEQQSGGK